MQKREEGSRGAIALEGTTSGQVLELNNSPASAVENVQIQELKELLGSCLSHPSIIGCPECVSDWKLLRFLRGYQHDSEKTAQAYAAMVKFRDDNSILGIRSELLELKDQTGQIPYPYTLPQFSPLVELIGDGLMHRHGFDRSGNIITSVLVGAWQVKKVAGKGKEMEELLICGQMYLDVYFDLVLHDLTLERGMLARRHDLLNVNNPSIGMFQFTPGAIGLIQKSTAGSKHYPEAVAKISSCGNGMFALGIWKLIAPFVPKHTVSKIQVLGKNYKKDLLVDIEENNIPEYFGGDPTAPASSEALFNFGK